jgi:uncharacterized protein
MPKVSFSGIMRAMLVVLSLCLIAVPLIVWLQQSKTVTLTMAAGARGGESYILGNALKRVVERHYPKVRIELLETGGTVENLRLLDSGRAQLAAAQSDVVPGPRARSVAVLYNDEFQLLVPADSTMKNFAALRGRRIALAPSGGQFQSFLRVADHFGLHPADFQFVGTTDETADQAFLNGQADAIFRVRALGNPSIRKLVQSGKVRFLRIEHAAAMKIKYPSFQSAVIPEGSYLGDPAVPAEDIPTVAVERTLLARDTANAAAVQAVASVLLEHRGEVMEEVPASMEEVRLLLVQVRRPETQTGLGPPLHPGAKNFYDKDKPSFLLAHADYVGLILTVGLMAGSWIWELKRWMQRQQKNTADLYSKRVVELIDTVQQIDEIAPLETAWQKLLAILGEAVHDLDEDKLSEESFNSFRAILQIGMEVARERRLLISQRSHALS